MVAIDDLERERHINDLQARVLAGQEVSPEEYELVIARLRQRRIEAIRPPTAKRKTEKINPETLF